MQTTLDLAACPFCGVADYSFDTECGRHWVYCCKCDAQGPYADSAELAAIAWQERAGARMNEQLACVALREHFPAGCSPKDIPDWKAVGDFDSDQLEALAWWWRQKAKD